MHQRPARLPGWSGGGRVVCWLILLAAGCAACETGPAPATPPIVPGGAGAPREVNLIDLVPGETVLLHVINGGLEVHEAIIGDGAVQDAWEAAEAAVAGAPPGPTPVVTVPEAVTGVRIVVRSGERVDLRWVVPAGGVDGVPGTVAPFIVGCHIPGHWERGMQIPVRWVNAP
jgi:hypothetical protein